MYFFSDDFFKLLVKTSKKSGAGFGLVDDDAEWHEIHKDVMSLLTTFLPARWWWNDGRSPGTLEVVSIVIAKGEINILKFNQVVNGKRNKK
jgi:hypothetical protein